MTRNKNKFFAFIIIFIVSALSTASLAFAKDIEYPKPDEAIVYSSAGLKTALTSTNVTKIYLGADVSVTQNDIVINTNNKKEITINGINPYDTTAIVHTLTDYNKNTTDSNNTIRVTSKNNLEKITLKDINIIGQNWYGIVFIRDGVKGITQEFQNVNYDGPQLIYNRGGFAILDNVFVTLRDSTSSKNTGEVAEANGVTLKNNVTINKTTILDYDEIFWITSDLTDKGYIVIEPNANVKVTNASYSDGSPSGFIYLDGKSDFKILEGATFEYTGYRIFLESKPMNTFLIGKDATVKINVSGQPSTGKIDFPLIKLDNKANIELNENSDFELILKNNKHAKPALYLQSGKIISDNPKNLLIYNDNGLAIKTEHGSGVEMTGSKIAYWNNASQDPYNLGTPKYLWQNKTGVFKAIGVTNSDGTFKIFNSYDYDNSADNLTIANFALKDIKVVSSNGSKQVLKHTVSFEPNGGTPVNSITANAGTTILKPADPIKANSVFEGWFKDTNLTLAWDFNSDIVNNDVTLYAKWSNLQSSYTVKYITNDMNKPYHTEPVNSNAFLTAPTEPTMNSFTFVGWSLNYNLTMMWDFSKDTVTGDVVLYAIFTQEGDPGIPLEHYVDFEAEGATNIPPSQDVKSLEFATEPTAPTKPNATFVGWFTEPEFINQWDFGRDKIYRSTVLYAKFQ